MDKRKLNEIEYLIWSFGQPNNMSMSVTIDGKLDKERLRNALDKVQEKHPMLQVQLITDENQFPCFIWDKVRKIPMEVIPRRRDNLYEEIIEEEFITPFETGIDSKFPLIRVKLLYSEYKSDIIITLQHVIGDGLSMGFIFRDLLSFYIDPPEHIKSVNIVKSIENILPEAIQKKIPKNARRFKVVVWFLKNVFLKYVRLKNWLFRRKRGLNITEIGKKEQRNFITNSWVLTKEQTKEFIRKCKIHNVTVHSAICTLFLEDFPSINNPVNLRNKLDSPLKDAVGCFAGGVVFSKEYNNNQTFWENAKQYNKKLRKKLNSTEVFKIFKLISRAVPLEDIKEFGPIFIEVESNQKPFAVTNLGSLDKLNLITTSEGINIEHIFGGVSSSFNAIILTVFTIQEKMFFHLHYYSPPYLPENMRTYVENAKRKINDILETEQ